MNRICACGTCRDPFRNVTCKSLLPKARADRSGAWTRFLPENVNLARLHLRKRTRIQKPSAEDCSYNNTQDQHVDNVLACKCRRFSHGVDLPVPKGLSPEEVQNHARAFSHFIFADWTKLNAALKRFEGTVKKRWLKKSPAQRRAILLQAWPDMAPTHRPDFAMGFRRQDKRTPRSRTLLSAAYLWPYVNLEDLQLRHLLPLFLNSRGRNLPYAFVTADIEAAHLGHGWRDEEEMETNSMQFHCIASPQAYGSFTNYKIGKQRGEDRSTYLALVCLRWRFNNVSTSFCSAVPSLIFTTYSQASTSRRRINWRQLCQALRPANGNLLQPMRSRFRIVCHRRWILADSSH